VNYGVKLHATLPIFLFLLLPGCNDTSGPGDTDPKVKTIVLSSPNQGDVYYPGDTIHISWEYKNCIDTIDTAFMTVTDLSLNGGLDFVPIIYRSVIHKTTAADTFWIVPDDSAYFTAEARIRAYEYNETSVTTMSGIFTIEDSGGRENVRDGKAEYWNDG